MLSIWRGWQTGLLNPHKYWLSMMRWAPVPGLLGGPPSSPVAIACCVSWPTCYWLNPVIIFWSWLGNWVSRQGLLCNGIFGFRVWKDFCFFKKVSVFFFFYFYPQNTPSRCGIGDWGFSVPFLWHPFAKIHPVKQQAGNCDHCTSYLPPPCPSVRSCSLAHPAVPQSFWCPCLGCKAQSNLKKLLKRQVGVSTSVV